MGILAKVLKKGIQKAKQKTPEGYDERYLTRKGDKAAVDEMTVDKDYLEGAFESPIMSVQDLEGRPWFSGMSDRTDANALITGINDVDFLEPVRLRGGQGHMKYGDALWASETGPVTRMYNRAQELKDLYGEDPLFLPFRMGPTGNDFAHMTGETMLEYARSAMDPSDLKKLGAELSAVTPEFKGFGSGLMHNYRNTKTKDRREMMRVLDTYRDKGGMSLSQARMAVSDPNQILAQEGGLMNIGLINPNMRPTRSGMSGHPTYSSRIEGTFLGELDPTERGNYNLYDLAFPRARELGINPEDITQNFPSPKLGKPTSPMYWARQGELIGGLLDEETLLRMSKLGLIR